MTDVTHDLLKEFATIKADVAVIKVKMENQGDVNKDVTFKLDHISSVLSALEDKVFPRKDIDIYFTKMREVQQKIDDFDKTPLGKKRGVSFSQIAAAIIAAVIAILSSLGIGLGTSNRILNMAQQWHEQDSTAIRTLQVHIMPPGILDNKE